MAVLFSASRSNIDCYFNLNLGQNPSFSPEFSSVAHRANWFFGGAAWGEKRGEEPWAGSRYNCRCQGPTSGAPTNW